PQSKWIHIGNPNDTNFVQQVLSDGRADAYICDNDTYAAQLMHELDNLGVSIPDDVRIAGFDDVSHAEHLRVPLTSYHQPCAQIGKVAVETLLARIQQPDEPAKTIQLTGGLVIRKSSGIIEE
ncbi:MAG: LacI family transcriptional regulator, partial [Desulfobulbaceae bacterium]|nr:LacI family transcriptional regulator [Desulfobulbaceae bacterium]